MIGKVIEKVEYGLFTFIYDIYELQYEYDEFSNLFLKIPNIMKVDILEYFEHLILGSFFSNKIDSNDIMRNFFIKVKIILIVQKQHFKANI